MKIGIMSMQRINNYGSWLQAYALRNILNSSLKKLSDGSIEFVDYRVGKPVYLNGFDFKSYVKDRAKVLITDAISSNKLLSSITPNPEFKHTNDLVNVYLPKLGVSRKKNYSPALDLLVIGSDEVFNCLQTNTRVGYSSDFFGQNQNASSITTYAASFGNTTLERLREYGKDKDVARWLGDLASISVRDENSRTVVRELIGAEPEVNLDPVLMYSFNREIVRAVEQLDQSILDSEYMIVYCYPNRITEAESQEIIEYAKHNHLEIIAVSNPQKFADKMIYDSPLNILAYFSRAKCVVTDTFHGTIFSVINKKPFASLVRSSKNGSYGNQEKLHDLLNRLTLVSQEVGESNTITNALNDEIDYIEVLNILSVERKHTRDYIDRIVSRAFIGD